MTRLPALVTLSSILVACARPVGPAAPVPAPIPPPQPIVIIVEAGWPMMVDGEPAPAPSPPAAPAVTPPAAPAAVVVEPAPVAPAAVRTPFRDPRRCAMPTRAHPTWCGELSRPRVGGARR